MPFLCSICGEPSARICARCTKDTCSNHLCDRCHQCSDCCECEVVLTDKDHLGDAGSARAVFRSVSSAARPVPEPDPDPEPPHPPPDPDPFPEDEPETGPTAP